MTTPLVFRGDHHELIPIGLNFGTNEPNRLEREFAYLLSMLQRFALISPFEGFSDCATESSKPTVDCQALIDYESVTYERQRHSSSL